MESLAHNQAGRSRTSEEQTALSQLEQKAGTLRQSSSNNFLVALEGLMLAAIAWESIHKPVKWISYLSTVTTAIGLAVMGIFTFNAINDRTKAAKAESKLAKYGFDEFSLPGEQTAPVVSNAPAGPAGTIHTKDAKVERLQQAPQQQIA